MMVIDRDALLAALESLGDSDDATALAAARTAAIRRIPTISDGVGPARGYNHCRR